MKKCRKEDDNILFIDASKEFEKIKTQNKLRPEHIQKIYWYISGTKRN